MYIWHEGRVTMYRGQRGLIGGDKDGEGGLLGEDSEQAIYIWFIMCLWNTALLKWRKGFINLKENKEGVWKWLERENIFILWSQK